MKKVARGHRPQHLSRPPPNAQTGDSGQLSSTRPHLVRLGLGLGLAQQLHRSCLLPANLSTGCRTRCQRRRCARHGVQMVQALLQAGCMIDSAQDFLGSLSQNAHDHNPTPGVDNGDPILQKKHHFSFCGPQQRCLVWPGVGADLALTWRHPQPQRAR